MMFKLAELNNLTVSWPVKIRIEPVNGDPVDAEFNAHFRVLPDPEVDTLSKSGDMALLDRVLIGWDGVVDDAGEPIEFSDLGKAYFCSFASIRVVLIESYFKSLAEAARKNSKRQLANG